MKEAAVKFPVVCFGEVGWDFLPGTSNPGASLFHLAYYLQLLGVQPAVITKAGMDGCGKKLIELFELWGITTDFFQLDDNLPTGRVIVKLNDNKELQYEMPGLFAWDHIVPDNAQMQIAENCQFFVFDSLVARSKTSRDTLYPLLHTKACRVLDLNLRNPYYSRETIEYLLRNTDLLKLNLSELELLTGWISYYATAEDRLRALQDKFLIKRILLTNSANQTSLFTDGLTFSRYMSPVEVVDPAGNGGAFVGALIFKLIEQQPLADAHIFAGSFASLTANKQGACPEFTQFEIMNPITSQNTSLPTQK